MGTKELSRIPVPDPPVSGKPARLISLDAYRGFVMLLLVSSVGGPLGIPRVAQHLQGNPFWDFLGYQCSHVPMVGCSFWDLIQPSFMFMVGVAMPYSYASRRAQGDSDSKLLAHTIYRSLILVLLGIYTESINQARTQFVFTNVLAQIGLGYPFVFLLVNKGLKVRLATLASILVGYWLFFALYPAPPAGFDYKALGAPESFTGFFSHWNLHTNPGADFDRWFLNLFPRKTPFGSELIYYSTLNFIPSMGHMILGLMAGELLRGPREAKEKFKILVWSGAACLGIGWIWGHTLCPFVKCLSTPSFTLFSTGWTFLMLAAFYGIIDIRGYKRWAFPLAVAGMNSIALYMMRELRPWIARNLRVHIDQGLFVIRGPTWEPMVQSLMQLSVLWLICFWMYRRKIFVRI